MQIDTYYRSDSEWHDKKYLAKWKYKKKIPSEMEVALLYDPIHTNIINY